MKLNGPRWSRAVGHMGNVGLEVILTLRMTRLTLLAFRIFKMARNTRRHMKLVGPLGIRTIVDATKP
jgi:hypothetical protein